MNPTLTRAVKTLVVSAIAAVPACRPHLFFPTTIVPTATPGLAYVIVHPSYGGAGARTPTFTQGDGLEVPVDEAQYILLCDARPIDGMHCELVSEVATNRESFTRTAPTVDGFAERW